MVQLLVIAVFLLSTLGSCRAKNTTVEVVGLMHCSDCMKHQSGTTSSSLGFEVLMRCNSNEMRARGNGGVDEHGKFNVTLSADHEISEDSGKAYGCYAKLQSRSGAPCHIQAPQTASLKIQTNSAAKQLVIKFSPITCQSAFFWPFPNLTFHGPSPPEYTAPPAPVNLPPAATPPIQPPLTPQPSYDPPAPSPPPTYQNPTTSPSSPPPSSPVYSRPSSPPLNAPIQSPISPERTTSPTPPPTTVIAPSAPPPSAGVSIPPRRRQPSPIPKAPPIPRLPLTPSVPRKYFNPPKSISKPPRSV